jgi:hypothetical protein
MKEAHWYPVKLTVLLVFFFLVEFNSFCSVHVSFLHSKASVRVLTPAAKTMAVSLTLRRLFALRAVSLHLDILADGRATFADDVIMSLRHEPVRPEGNLRIDSNSPVCDSETCLGSKFVMRVNEYWTCVFPRKHSKRSENMSAFRVISLKKRFINVIFFVLYVCICRGGFPHAPRPYVVYCTSPMNIQTAAMPTHRASPLVPPTREERN